MSTVQLPMHSIHTVPHELRTASPCTQYSPPCTQYSSSCAQYSQPCTQNTKPPMHTVQAQMHSVHRAPHALRAASPRSQYSRPCTQYPQPPCTQYIPVFSHEGRSWTDRAVRVPVKARPKPTLPQGKCFTLVMCLIGTHGKPDFNEIFSNTPHIYLQEN